MNAPADHPPPRLVATGPATALSRATASRPGAWLRSLLGIRRAIVVEGVRYRELTAEPLARALSRRGSGSKDYAVSFPGGRRMRITVTPSTAYEDLSGPALIAEYRLAQPFIRPGMRVIALRAGSGYAGAWLSRIVGPSGSVVALDPDPEVIRYARWRYRLGNVAFEVGDHASLGGEIEGAFQAALAVRADRLGEDSAPSLSELWRVLSPGGCLIATIAAGPDRTDDARPPSAGQLLDALLAPSRSRPHADPHADPPDHPPSPSKVIPPPESRVLAAPEGVIAAMIRKPPHQHDSAAA